MGQRLVKRLGVALVLAVSCAATAAEPMGVIPGWERQDGRVLLGELSCAACHDAGPAAARLSFKQPPLLGEVGARVAPQYLRELLADPQACKPGSPMPDLLHGLPEAERRRAIDELTQFLAARGGPLALDNGPPDAKLVESGKTLYHLVGCVACHAPLDKPLLHKLDPSSVKLLEALQDEQPAGALRAGVPLPALARKTNLAALARFLANPLHARPSGRMPSLNLSPDEARAIAAYLLVATKSASAAPSPAAAPFQPDPTAAARGQARFAALGCAACHDTAVRPAPEPLEWAARKPTIAGIGGRENRSPPNEAPPRAIDGDAKTKYLNFGGPGSGLLITIPGAPVLVAGLTLTTANDYPQRDPAAYLLEGSADGKTFVRLDARPLDLPTDRHAARTFVFDNQAEFSVFRLTFPKLRDGTGGEMQIAEVQLLISKRPQPGVASTLKAPPLARLRAEAAGSCLQQEPAAGRPRFAFSPAQRSAVAEALRGAQGTKAAPNGTAAVAPAAEVDWRMASLGCYACHVRGEKGGPEPARQTYFVYDTVVDWGDEGRLPPPLNETGAKLTPLGWQDMLTGGVRYRTYMGTRMPQFGAANVHALPALFAAADAGKIPPHQPRVTGADSKATGKLLEDGRKLIGKKGLACINCHAWGSARLPGAEGLDLLYAARRLTPEWYHAWLVDPQPLRPRTRMPTAWPQGKSFFPDLLAGDMHAQIDATWAVLLAGERAGLPEGLKPGKNPLLLPYDEPIVFRTFTDQVGAHAILVGFRERSHVAFDANRVRMVLAWSGDFISPDAAWEGRAGQYAKIPGEIVRFPEGPPLALLASQGDPWPADLPKPKFGTARTPPGWRWQGYRLDEQRVPTFLYRAGDVQVEETPAADVRQAGGCIIRRFRLSAERDIPGLHFRVAVGKQIDLAGNKAVIDGRQTIILKSEPSATPLVRESDGAMELLVPVRLAPVKTGTAREARIEWEWNW